MNRRGFFAALAGLPFVNRFVPQYYDLQVTPIDTTTTYTDDAGYHYYHIRYFNAKGEQLHPPSVTVVNQSHHG